MKPSPKNPVLAQAMDRLAFATYGRTRTAAIHNNMCVACGQAVGQFRDKLSEKEFSMSGMCQKCQDKTFDIPED